MTPSPAVAISVSPISLSSVTSQVLGSKFTVVSQMQLIGYRSERAASTELRGGQGVLLARAVELARTFPRW